MKQHSGEVERRFVSIVKTTSLQQGECWIPFRIESTRVDSRKSIDGEKKQNTLKNISLLSRLWRFSSLIDDARRHFLRECWECSMNPNRTRKSFWCPKRICLTITSVTLRNWTFHGPWSMQSDNPATSFGQDSDLLSTCSCPLVFNCSSYSSSASFALPSVPSSSTTVPIREWSVLSSSFKERAVCMSFWFKCGPAPPGMHRLEWHSLTKRTPDVRV